MYFNFYKIFIFILLKLPLFFLIVYARENISSKDFFLNKHNSKIIWRRSEVKEKEYDRLKWKIDNKNLFKEKTKLKIFEESALFDYINNDNYLSKIRDGVFVSSSSFLNPGKKNFNYTYLNDSSDFYKLNFGISRSFNLDFSSELINTKSNLTNSFKNTYLEPGSRSARGGGTIKIFSQERGDIISTNFRLTFGGVLGETRYRYMFGELMNTYSINNLLSFNFNPKFSYTESGNIYSIGSSVNWKLHRRIEVIPETNFALHNAENNFSLICRISLTENIIIDSFISNSYGMIDMAQQLKNENTRYGVKVKLNF